MKPPERNGKIKSYLDSIYKMATKHDFSDKIEYAKLLDILFSSSAHGFREVVLVAVVGIYLDRNFRASSSFYDCNPRAIYEGPIKKFLLAKGIPHTKSGPLNVAKATPGLNTTWAKQRKPANVAGAVVELVDYIEQANIKIDEINNFGASLMARFINEAKRVENLSIDIEPSSDPDYIYDLCETLIIEAPDYGNTPQRIAALLLKNYHQSLKTGVIIAGEKDRASATSTTSKKPGDMNEESISGTIYKVYEVTVKKFDGARILDSYDSVVKYNKENNGDIHEIVVICREEDCPREIKTKKLSGYLGKYKYQDIIYYYWNIFEWISNMLQRMTPLGRTNFYNDLNSYINGVNTAEIVKEVWVQLQED